MSEALGSRTHVPQHGTVRTGILEGTEARRPQCSQLVECVAALLVALVALVVVPVVRHATARSNTCDSGESTGTPALRAADNLHITDFNWARITAPVSGPCSAVLALSVGTGQGKEAYDTLAQAIVGQSNEKEGYVVVVIDPNPGWLVKSNPDLYTKSVQRAQRELRESIGQTCNNSIRYWILGGHSGGGVAAHKAAVKAAANNLTLGHAIFSLDPFEKTIPVERCPLPAVYWGFTNTTCCVNTTKAARAYYDVTEYNNEQRQHRMLYTVNGQAPYPVSSTRAERKGPEPSGAFGHCSFLTHGRCTVPPYRWLCFFWTKKRDCKGLSVSIRSCGSSNPPLAFHGHIAQSFAALVTSLDTGKWKRAVDVPLAVKTFADADAPPPLETGWKRERHCLSWFS